MKRFLAALAAMTLAAPASAQSLSAEDIARMLDEQTAAPNPYADLLNDPDPARSLGAMTIMMESGDPALVDLALEFGLLSANPQVQRAALERYLLTQPYLDFVLDCQDVDDQTCTREIRNRLGATLDTDSKAYFRAQIGEYNSDWVCFTWRTTEECAVTLRPAGIFLSGDMVQSKLTIQQDGTLFGSSAVYDVDDPVPLTIQILD